MTFDLTGIALAVVVAIVYSALLRPQQRAWALMILSVVAVYVLQPALPVRFADFILPTATLVLTIILWLFVGRAETRINREDRAAMILIVLVVLVMSLMRYIQPQFRLTPSRPPDPLWVMLALAGTAVIVLAVRRITMGRRGMLDALIVLMIGVFIVLKAEPLAVEVSQGWRALTGQDTTLAAVTDLGWLGFSYVAFRLIHTVRDRQMDKLPELSLREFMTYVVFFPAFIAGPIDRAERFTKDLQALPHMSGLEPLRFTEGMTRIMVGIFKKFVIADTLALGLALNPINADQAISTPGLWVLLYGYALRLFFDFSGYTDVAIGIGILLGIRLPENFNRPYSRTSITAFWQSWHMTLSNWARFYVFTPVSRALLTRKPKPSPILIVLLAQLTTMIVIGLWHGITLNFFIWGAWHGVGLFIHKQWTDRTRPFYRRLEQRPALKRLESAGSWFLTFHFVMLGWVWFALPQTAQSVRVLRELFAL
ncbi:MAG: hypothetical protein OHK0046_24140 [Anaerolineae bacterium]